MDGLNKCTANWGPFSVIRMSLAAFGLTSVPNYTSRYLLTKYCKHKGHHSIFPYSILTVVHGEFYDSPKFHPNS